MAFLVLLVGCEKQEYLLNKENKIAQQDIMIFSRQFEQNNLNIDFKNLNKQEQQTLLFIDELINFYIKQAPSQSYANMKQYLKNKDVIITNDGEDFFRIEDKKNLLSTSNIDTTLNDGSGLRVSFNRSHGTIDEEEYTIILAHLTQHQCAYFQKYFNDNPNMIPGGIMCDGQSYGMMTIYNRPDKDLSSYRHMEKVYQDIRLLLNLKYTELDTDKNIYFTENKPINSYFFNQVNYLINPKKPDIVYIGGLSNFICKKALYYQPKDIKAAVLHSKNNSCSKESHNIIEFSLIKQ